MSKLLIVINLVLATIYLALTANLATSHQCKEKLETAEVSSWSPPFRIEAKSPTFGWVDLPDANIGIMMAWQAIMEKDGPEKAASFLDACQENLAPNQGELAPVVAAIRMAENGGPGREYGILHPRVEETYRSQAGWCAATVAKNYDRWDGGAAETDFIEFLGNRYCPVGADNDPDGLNVHWRGNVSSFVEEIWGSSLWKRRLRDPLTGETWPL